MAKRDPLYPDVAVYGAPGAGKSTAAAFMLKLGFTRVSFAGYHRGGLRDVVRRMGLNPDDRRTLNIIGMAAREIDPDVWVRNMIAESERISGPVITDDLRGDNEWNRLLVVGFVFVHVVADDELREQRLTANGRLAGSRPEDNPFLYELEDTNRYHPDHVIVNNGSEQELHEAIVDILNLERRKRA